MSFTIGSGLEAFDRFLETEAEATVSIKQSDDIEDSGADIADAAPVEEAVATDEKQEEDIDAASDEAEASMSAVMFLMNERHLSSIALKAARKYGISRDMYEYMYLSNPMFSSYATKMGVPSLESFVPSDSRHQTLLIRALEDENKSFGDKIKEGFNKFCEKIMKLINAIKTWFIQKFRNIKNRYQSVARMFKQAKLGTGSTFAALKIVMTCPNPEKIEQQADALMTDIHNVHQWLKELSDGIRKRSSHSDELKSAVLEMKTKARFLNSSYSKLQSDANKWELKPDGLQNIGDFLDDMSNKGQKLNDTAVEFLTAGENFVKEMMKANNVESDKESVYSFVLHAVQEQLEKVRQKQSWLMTQIEKIKNGALSIYNKVKNKSGNEDGETKEDAAAEAYFNYLDHEIKSDLHALKLIGMESYYSNRFIKGLEDEDPSKKGYWQKFKDWVEKICTKIKNFFKSIKDWFVEKYNKASSSIESTINMYKHIKKNTGSVLKTLKIMATCPNPDKVMNVCDSVLVAVQECTVFTTAVMAAGSLELGEEKMKKIIDKAKKLSEDFVKIDNLTSDVTNRRDEYNAAKDCDKIDEKLMKLSETVDKVIEKSREFIEKSEKAVDNVRKSMKPDTYDDKVAQDLIHTALVNIQSLSARVRKHQNWLIGTTMQIKAACDKIIVAAKTAYHTTRAKMEADKEDKQNKNGTESFDAYGFQYSY